MSIRKSFLPFSRPTIGPEEINEVVDTLKSGWITTGPKTERFENDFASYIGSQHSIALASATAGLHLALLAMDICPGDEVITSSMTFAATVNQIVLRGATPVLVDIDYNNMLIDVKKIEAKITPKTKLILPVHFAGAPVDMDPIIKLAHQHGLKVLEDAAHAVGTRYKSKHVGCLGTAGVFSFHPIKNMTTGEGGIFATNDNQLAEKVRLLKFHGLSKEAWKRYQKESVSQYDVMIPGYKYNMMDIQAALGIQQLAKLDTFIRQRTQLAAWYDELLAEVTEIERPARPVYDHLHTWHLYIIKLRLERLKIDRDTFMQELKKRNIGTGLHFKAIHLHDYYQKTLGYPRGSLPVTEKASESIVSLPLFPLMTQDDIRDVVLAIKDIISLNKN